MSIETIWILEWKGLFGIESGSESARPTHSRY